MAKKQGGSSGGGSLEQILKSIERNTAASLEQQKKSIQRAAGVGGARGSQSAGGNAAGAAAQVLSMGKVGGLAGAATGVLADIANETKEAFKAAQRQGTNVFEQAGGLEDADTVASRATFREQSARRPELIRAAGRLAEKYIPFFGDVVKQGLDRDAAQHEFNTRQLVEPELAAIGDAKSRTQAILSGYARATGEAPSEEIIRQVFEQQRPGAEAVTSLAKGLNKIAGQAEQAVYQMPQIQARALTFGG